MARLRALEFTPLLPQTNSRDWTVVDDTPRHRHAALPQSMTGGRLASGTPVTEIDPRGRQDDDPASEHFGSGVRRGRAEEARRIEKGPFAPAAVTHRPISSHPSSETQTCLFATAFRCFFCSCDTPSIPVAFRTTHWPPCLTSARSSRHSSSMRGMCCCCCSAIPSRRPEEDSRETNTETTGTRWTRPPTPAPFPSTLPR